MSLKLALYLTALAAHLPLLLTYVSNMWNKGHYQYFPLLIMVAGWLIYSRLENTPKKPDRRSGQIATVLLALNVLGLAVATVLFSPILIFPALMLLIAAFLMDTYGTDAFRKVFPAWLLLIFAAPLPGSIDFMLIQKMQFLASQLASYILDAFGQIHFKEGVVLVTEKRQFFTEEACSGIRSLFSSLAAIAIYGVIREYSLARHVFNLVQTTFWVIVGNAIRVAVVVYAADNWNEAIATGTSHQMLGMAVFVFIFCLALSTDRAVNAITLAQKNPEDEVGEIEITISPTGQLRRPNPVSRWAFVVVFACIFLFSARLAIAISQNESLYQVENVRAAAPVAEADLPSEINGWRASEFEHVIRSEDALMAAESFIWKMEKAGKRVTISFDSPYPRFHDLTVCYNGLGWDANLTNHYADSDQPEQNDGYSLINMSRNDQHGMVIFSALAANGQLLLPPETFSVESRLKSAISNVQLVCGLEERRSAYFMNLPEEMLPVSQIQILLIDTKELSEADQEEIRNLFLKIRSLLLESVRFSKGS